MGSASNKRRRERRLLERERLAGRWPDGPKATVPVADILALREEMRQYSVPVEEWGRGRRLPIRITSIGPDLGFYSATLDDLLSELTAQGVTSIQPVIVRGRAGFAAGMGMMVMVPWESGGVIVGTAEAVSAALDDEGAAAAAGGEADE